MGHILQAEQQWQVLEVQPFQFQGFIENLVQLVSHLDFTVYIEAVLQDISFIIGIKIFPSVYGRALTLRSCVSTPASHIFINAQ